jgi:hypothetical protein
MTHCLLLSNAFRILVESVPHGDVNAPDIRKPVDDAACSAYQARGKRPPVSASDQESH